MSCSVRMTSRPRRSPWRGLVAASLAALALVGATPDAAAQRRGGTRSADAATEVKDVVLAVGENKTLSATGV